METMNEERKSIWTRMEKFMCCVYEHDMRVWRSIFGDRM